MLNLPRRLVLIALAGVAAHCGGDLEPFSDEWNQAKRVQVDILRPATYPLTDVKSLAFVAPQSMDSADVSTGMQQDLQSVERFDMGSNQAQARVQVTFAGSSVEQNVSSDTAMQDGNVVTTYTRTVAVFAKTGVTIQQTASPSTTLASYQVTTKAEEVQGTVQMWGEAVNDKTYQMSLFAPPVTTELLRNAKRRAARTLAQDLVPHYETVTILLYTIDLPDSSKAAQKAQSNQWPQAQEFATNDLGRVAGKSKKLTAKAHYNLAMTQLFNGNVNDAVTHLQQAVALHPAQAFHQALEDAQGYQLAQTQAGELGYTPHPLSSL